MTLLEAYSVIILVAATVFLFMKLYEVLVMPVRFGKASRLEAVLHVTGEAPELEQTVRSILYLKNKMRMDLVIIDEGMDAATRKTAELLAGTGSGVCLFVREDYREPESVNGEGIHTNQRDSRNGDIP